MKNRIYAGIGSQKTPQDAIDDIKFIASKMAQLGYKLRSGGARGADLAFESTCGTNKSIYKPFKGFGGGGGIVGPDLDNWMDALAIAKRHHPNWLALERIRNGAFLMGRNVYQVLGRDLNNPVDFVLFWAPSVKRDENNKVKDCKGGTGLGVRLAYHYGIDVFHVQEDREYIDKYILTGNYQKDKQPKKESCSVETETSVSTYIGRWKRR